MTWTWQAGLLLLFFVCGWWVWFLKLPRRPHYFCTRCGERLVRDNTIISYDQVNGDPIYRRLGKRICPNKDCPIQSYW